MLSALKDADWLTADRVRRLAFALTIAAMAVLTWNVWDRTQMGLTNSQGQQLGADFINYWSGAHLAADGRADTVYDINAFVAFERSVLGQQANFRWYSYPPVLLALTLPLAPLPFLPALVLWEVLGVGLSAYLLSRLMNWKAALLAALSTPAALMNAVAGQNGQWSAALLVGGLMLLKQRPILAGILFGFLIYKPQLAVLVPFALLASRNWRAFASAAITVCTFCTLTGFMFGWGVWAAFAKTAPINRLLLEQGTHFLHHAAPLAFFVHSGEDTPFSGFLCRMPTVFTFARSLGGGVTTSYGVQALSAIAAIVIIARVWRSNAPDELKYAALVVGTFLATPYAWDYDMVMLTFAVSWFAITANRTGFYSWEKLGAATLILMPTLMVSVAHNTNLQIGAVALWAMMGLIARRTLWPAPLLAKHGAYNVADERMRLASTTKAP